MFIFIVIKEGAGKLHSLFYVTTVLKMIMTMSPNEVRVMS
jgi:hypothetical protein